MSGLASKDNEPRSGQIPKPGQKLRLACDECNKAKVRCTKEKPTCSRCKIQNVQCVYGISLRAGKRAAVQGPRRAQTQPQRPNAVSDDDRVREKLAAEACSNFIAPEEHHHSTSQEHKLNDVPDSFIYADYPSGVMDYREFDMFSTSLQPQTIQPYDVDPFPKSPDVQMSDWLQGWTEHDWLASNNQTPNIKASPAAQTFDWDSTSNSASASATPGLTCSPADSSSPSSSVSSFVGLTTSGSCQAMQPSMPTSFSTSYLSDLDLPVHARSPNKPFQSPNLKRSKCQCQIAIVSVQKVFLRLSDFESTAFDVALAANREILRLCTTFIECECFATDDSNVMLLSSIIARMTSMYWARASVLGTPSSTSAFAGPADTVNRLAEGTKKGSLALGAYHTNNADEERQKMEIVLVELEKLERLVQEFQNGCYKSGCVASELEDRDSKNQSLRAHVWRSLFEFLTHKVWCASTELRSKILADGHTHRR